MMVFLSNCSLKPYQSAITVQNGNTAVNSAFDYEGTSVAVFDPDSLDPQLITASTTGNLKGSQVTFPPGSLAIAAQIIVEESASLDEGGVLDDLNLNSDNSVTDAGPGIIIRPSEGVDVSKPFTLEIPLPAGISLNLADNEDNLVVIYRTFTNSSSNMESGLIPLKELLINNGFVKFQAPNFGAFQAVKLAKKVEIKITAPTTKPIQNSKKETVADAGGFKKEDALTPTKAAKLVETRAHLPNCSQTIEGTLYYVALEQIFVVCLQGSFKDINLKGDKGDTGEIGASGKDGATGAAGSDGKAGESAEAGEKLYRTATNSEVGILKGFGANQWLKFKEGFFTMLTQIGNYFTPEINDIYFADSSCTTSPMVAFDLNQAPNQLFYTAKSTMPYISTGIMTEYDGDDEGVGSVVRVDGSCKTVSSFERVDHSFSGSAGSLVFVNAGSKAYAFSNTGSNPGEKIVFSISTSGTTTSLVDITPASMSYSNNYDIYYSSQLGKVFFSAQSTLYGTEAWVLDPQTDSITLLKDIGASTSSSYPGKFVEFNGLIYFNANDQTNGNELWKTDGTSSGTVMVQDFYAGSNGSNPYNFMASTSTLYFTATSSAHGNELYKLSSDGTTIELVSDIFTGATGSNPSYLTLIGSKVFFRANAASNDSELWMLNTSDNTVSQVKDIHSSGSSYPEIFMELNGKLYFYADDGINGKELWVSDGTSSGTNLLKDIYAGSQSSYACLYDCQEFAKIGNTLYFYADSLNKGRELWKSDGTASGTSMVKDINSSGSADISEITTIGNKIIFDAKSNSGEDLWISDGTSAGTVMVGELGSHKYRSSSSSGDIYRVGSNGSNQVYTVYDYSIYVYQIGSDPVLGISTKYGPDGYIKVDAFSGYQDFSQGELIHK